MSAYDDIAQGLKLIRDSKFVSGGARKSYAEASPKESPRVLAYLDGGPEPSPLPTTLMGSGLAKVERGKRALQPTPQPPSSGAFGMSYLRYGDGLLPPTHVNDYDLCVISWGGAAAAAAARTKPVLHYMSQVTCLESSTYSYGVQAAEARANNWIMKTAGGVELTNVSYAGSPLGDPGIAGYQTAWCNNVLARLQATGVDGFFIDDVNQHYNGISGGALTPKYPDADSWWSNAVMPFFRAVGPFFASRGYFVAINLSPWYPGIPNGWETDGTSSYQKYPDLAPYIDGVHEENWLVHQATGTIRKMGAEWYNHWDGWMRLPARAAELGMKFLGTMGLANSAYADYATLSALLEGNRNSTVFYTVGYDYVNQIEPWHATYDRLLTLGAPLGAKVQNGNRWQRQYEGGLVWVDPVVGTAGIS